MEQQLNDLVEQFAELKKVHKKDREELQKLKNQMGDQISSEEDSRKEKLEEELKEALEVEKELQEKLEATKKRRVEIEEELGTSSLKFTGRGLGGKRFDTRAPEEKMELSFGGEQNASALHLRQFIEHYKLVRMVNIRNTLANWDDPSYRAAKLRIALKGAPADFVGEESSISRAWTEDDEQILKKLKERYIDTESIELKIMEAEEVIQEENEPLAEYLSRVQRVMRVAYPEEPENILNKRAAWKFISGIRNREIRGAVIKEKWMQGQETKPLEEILLIAESTRKTIVATNATGQEKGTLNAVLKRNPRNSDESGSSSNSRRSSGESLYSKSSNTSKTSSNYSFSNGECLYCKKRHPGGWRTCYSRLRNDPRWTPPPQKKKSNYNRGNVQNMRGYGDDENF